VKRYLRPTGWALSERFKRGWRRIALGSLLLAFPVLAQTPVFATLDRADFIQTGDLTAPPADAHWQSVALPDSWRKQGRSLSRVGWYRLTLNLSAIPSSPQAIYIPRITNNVAVHVNGTLIGVSGNLEKAELSWNLAQFFIVPPQLLQPGRNEILIRLHPDGLLRAGLSRVSFGPEWDIRELYETRYFYQTTAPKFIAALLGMTALFSLGIWASRWQEAVFGYFALLCLASIARLWHTFTRDAHSLGWLFAAPSLSWMVAMQTYFVLRFCNKSSPRFEKLTLYFAALATVTLFITQQAQVVGVMFVANTVISIAMLYILGRALTREPRFENIILLQAIVTNFGLAIHDLINYQELMHFDTLYLLPLGMPLLLFAMAILLIRQFVGILRKHETLNRELAGRVRDRERELAVSYERVRTADQQRATAEERQHLMREMHDGIGSHLMSTLALARTGSLTQEQVIEALADCIDELKITIDSLEPVERDLLVVLGNLRYRLEPRLNMAGITLEWAVKDLPPLEYLDPENVRNVLRIVQEAFTNTLKHAGAKRITLSTGVDYTSNRVLVRVTDDGVGITDQARNGRGIANMKNRAAKLRGQLELLPLRGGGTCMNLYLPITLVGKALVTPEQDDAPAPLSSRTFGLF
jgi:signal transduction histidine kinase